MARKTSRKQRLVQENSSYMETSQNEKFDDYRPITPKNPSQVDAMNYLRTRTLTILTGPPGTAKTLLSIYIACEKLKKREIEKIYYVKPVVKTPGEEGLGFLPGDLSEKVAPHISPVRDSLGVFLPKGKVDYIIDKKIIEFVPIEHLRGRSLNRCFVIADEMQNATTHSVMTILTRLGENSSIALLGDVVQRDLANKYGNDGLTDAVNRLKYLPGVGHVDFGFSEIVRSGFVERVIRAYSDLYSVKK